MTDSRWGRARRNSLHDRICLARNDPATILDREEQVSTRARSSKSSLHLAHSHQVNFATTYLICAVLGQNDEVNVELGELAESSHSSQESTHVGPFVQQLMEIEKQYGEHEFALHEETVENVRMVVDTVWRHVVPRSAAPGQLTEPGTWRSPC